MQNLCLRLTHKRRACQTCWIAVVYPDDGETRVDLNPLRVLRWVRLGELWAEDQFGNPDGKDAALRRLQAALIDTHDFPDDHSWSQLIQAYELRWGALRRDWLARRTTDPKPFLDRALGIKNPRQV